MDLIFNELSTDPIAENKYVFQERLRLLFKTFSTAKKPLKVNRISVPVRVFESNVYEDKTLSQSINELPDKNIQQLLLGILNKPFSDDLNDEDLESFLKSDYQIESEYYDKQPCGLPISYIQSKVAISLLSHEFWKNTTIPLMVISEMNGLETTVHALNISQPEAMDSNDLKKRAEKINLKDMSTENDLIGFLNFNQFAISFEIGFLEQLISIKNEDFTKFKYVLRLMKDVELHPFVGGLGRTENLKNRGKEASKRINITDRLSYSLNQNTVNFISCIGHYDFH